MPRPCTGKVSYLFEEVKTTPPPPLHYTVNMAYIAGLWSIKAVFSIMNSHNPRSFLWYNWLQVEMQSYNRWVAHLTQVVDKRGLITRDAAALLPGRTCHTASFYQGGKKERPFHLHGSIELITGSWKHEFNNISQNGYPGRLHFITAKYVVSWMVWCTMPR